MSELSLHNLKPQPGSRKKSVRVGRGNSSGVGTYSGRGLKGQRSRSGGKGGLKLLGLKNLLRNKPKIGGFKSLKPKDIPVTLAQLQKNFNDGEIVNVAKLRAKSLIPRGKVTIKILSTGELTKKLTVVSHGFSESAKLAIEKAGGKAQAIIRPVKLTPKQLKKALKKKK